MTPSTLRRARLSTAFAAAALLLAACGGGADTTPLASGAAPPADCVRVDAEGVISLSADDIEFSAPCMVANAGEAFTIHFENREDQPHNVALYRDSGKDNEILRGEIITGPEVSADYEVEALDAGEYYFDCTVHPTEMNGALYVVEP